MSVLRVFWTYSGVLARRKVDTASRVDTHHVLTLARSAENANSTCAASAQGIGYGGPYLALGFETC